ncbi:MAG: hypothetical protein AAFQ85_11565 [Pseudomonadota bacterium]
MTPRVQTTEAFPAMTPAPRTAADFNIGAPHNAGAANDTGNSTGPTLLERRRRRTNRRASRS